MSANTQHNGLGHGSSPQAPGTPPFRAPSTDAAFSHVTASVVTVPPSPGWAIFSSSSPPLPLSLPHTGDLHANRLANNNKQEEDEDPFGDDDMEQDYVLASYFDQASTIAPTAAPLSSSPLPSPRHSLASNSAPLRGTAAAAPTLAAMPPPSTVPSRNGRRPSQQPVSAHGLSNIPSRTSCSHSHSRPSSSARSVISSASLGVLAPSLAKAHSRSQGSTYSSSRKRAADRASLDSSPPPHLPPSRSRSTAHGRRPGTELGSQECGSEQVVTMSTPRPPTTRASTRPATRARSVMSATGTGDAANRSEPEHRFLVALFSPKSVTGGSSGRDKAGSGGGATSMGNSGGGPSGEMGICIFDLVTTTCLISQFIDSKTLVQTLNKLNVYPPSHLLVPSTFYKPEKSEMAILLENNLDGAVEIIPMSRKHFSATNGIECIRQYALEDQVQHLETGLGPNTLAVSALAALFKFIETDRHLTFTRSGVHIIHDAVSGTMFIDAITARNLELVRNQTGMHAHTLLGVLNKCQTVMGARLLRSTILQPPIIPDTIELRLNAVADLVSMPSSVQALGDDLKQVPNLDKLISGFIHIHHKATTVKSSELDLALILDLRTALTTFPSFVTSLAPFSNPLLAQAQTILSNVTLDEMLTAINELFAHELTLSHTPIGQRNQRAFAIKSGVHGLLDVSRRTYQEAVADILQLVDDYTSRYAVPFRAVFQAASHGFVLECKVDQIPPEVLDEHGALPEAFVNVVWKSKVVVCTTLEVMKLNERIQESMNEIFLISDRIVMDLKDELRSRIGALYKVSESIALVDLLCCFARLSLSGTYVRPILSKGMTVISQGRHPILAAISDRTSALARSSAKRDAGIPAANYVPNDAYFDFGCNVQVITGANGAGKTCYLKQVALITIMAHMGCPVPAQEAVVCVTDVMLSRMSFDDSLLANASTFTLEMREVAHILREVAEVSWVDKTVALDKGMSRRDEGSVVEKPAAADDRLVPIERSALVLMDEIGRGTSPNEAVGIAYAIVEALAHTKAFVLFATHFHQLFAYLERYPNIVHLHLAMHVSTPSDLGSNGTKLNYDYLVQDGPSPTTRGYGIQLASSVQLPTQLLATASQVADRVAHMHGLVTSDPNPEHAFHRAVHESARRVVAIKYNPHLDEHDRARCLSELQAELRPSFPGLELRRARSTSAHARAADAVAGAGIEAQDVAQEHRGPSLGSGFDTFEEYESPMSPFLPWSSDMDGPGDPQAMRSLTPLAGTTVTGTRTASHCNGVPLDPRRPSTTSTTGPIATCPRSPPTPHPPTAHARGSSLSVSARQHWRMDSAPTTMRLTDSIGMYDPVRGTFVPPRPSQFGVAAGSVMSIVSQDVTDPIED